MSIATEITRLQSAKADLKTAIEGKGVTVPSETTLDGYAGLVDSISGGGGGTTVTSLSVTENGTYTAQSGSAYSPVIVNVPSGDYAPTGYTRLKYLESSGTQIIDTGKYLKLSSKAECDCHYLSVNQGSYAFMFGSQNPIFGAMVLQSLSYPSSTSANYWSFGNVSDIAPSPSVIPFVRGFITIDKTQGTVKYSDYDDTKSTAALNATSVTENQNSHICLFGRQNNGTYERFAKCRIYEYWYYENDVLLQHMIPLKRDSDDVLGMYDLVSSTFFTNAGTGAFTSDLSV